MAVKRKRQDMGRNPGYVPPRGPGPNPNAPSTYTIGGGIPGVAQPGRVGGLPTVNVRQDAPTATIPWRFSPYKPPAPPAGTYDPTLDVNLAAAHRGYGDLQTDIGTQQTRGLTDYLTGVAGIQQNASRGYQDLGSQLTDLLTGRTNETADYGTHTADLQHSYGVLAGNQLQQQNAAGVLGGGAAAQAAAKRAANQQHDQSGLDVAHQRYTDASTVAEDRLGTARTRLGQDTGYDASGAELGSLPTTSQLAGLRLNLAPPDAAHPLGGRSYQDWTQALQRGGREDVQAGIDTAKIKAAQAGQAGWAPPGKGEAGGQPKNEFIGPDGKHYQTHVVGNEVVTVDASGRVVSRKKRPGVGGITRGK